MEELHAELQRFGIASEMLSGDVDQRKRLRILEDFKTGKTQVIVATDVAGRGIHVDDVTHVINYDFPYEAEVMLPIGIYILCFDTICFTRKAMGLEPLEIYIRYSVGTVLTVIGLVYIFQAIYHYYYPVPQVIEAIEETKKARLEEEQKALETQEKSEENSEEENEKA